MQTSWSPGTACHLCRACTPTTAWPALMAKCFFANCPSEEGQHPLWPPIFNFSFILDSNSFYTFSAKNASKCQKTLSNGKNSPNPLIQDPTMPDWYQGEGFKLSILLYHRLHRYLFSWSVLRGKFGLLLYLLGRSDSSQMPFPEVLMALRQVINQVQGKSL